MPIGSVRLTCLPAARAYPRPPRATLFNNFDDLRARLIALAPLGLTVSNPPAYADVQAIADKLDEVITDSGGG